MSKLMDELMAEAQRVQDLRCEVNRTINNKKAEINHTRVEKWENEIFPFLHELDEAVRSAGCCEYKMNAYTGVDAIEYDGYRRNVMISYSRPYLNSVAKIGGYWSGSGDVGGTQGITLKMPGWNTYTAALIDGWNEEVKQIIEKNTAQIIKRHLEREMEKMRNELEKVNTTYEKHFGKEN